MTFKVFSLGCKVNSYECNAIASDLINNGFIEDEENPDIVIINTCSVTSVADKKSRQHIRKFKHDFPKAIIVVMGCYAQGNKEYLLNENIIDILIGTSNRNKIVSYINLFLKSHKRIIDINNDVRNLNYEELGITSFSENVRAYLKIQDGCDNFCTYCIVPYRRGKSRSRKLENVIDEAKFLVSKSYKEIVLSGVHIGRYGKDLNDSLNFSKLLNKITKINDLERIRISSIEESEIDDDLIKLIKNNSNIAKHLHIPLQSGSNKILKLMNRKYCKEDFISKIMKIKKEIPDIILTTDVIVGFPNEDENDFNETYDVCKKCFDMLHVFQYSKREGTVASKMENQIDDDIKAIRSKKLLELSKNLYNDFCNKNISSDVRVLIEKYDKEKDLNIGHTSNYIEVKIKGKNKSFVGEFLNVKLNKNMIV